MMAVLHQWKLQLSLYGKLYFFELSLWLCKQQQSICTRKAISRLSKKDVSREFEFFLVYMAALLINSLPAISWYIFAKDSLKKMREKRAAVAGANLQIRYIDLARSLRTPA